MIYVIMGPTCSGKTAACNKIMDILNCDAINFDAFQIYKHMDIGTSKLDKNDPHYSRYHLLDFKEPSETYSVMEYQRDSRNVLDNLLSKCKDVVMVGGTGLYVRAALYDYEFEIEENRDDSDLELLSNEELFNELQKLDYEASKKIHINNRKRLIRAISSIRHSDINKTERLAKQSHLPIYKDVEFLFLSPNREELYKNINARVIEMIDNGLVEEVKNLLENYDLSLTSKQGIGYKEIIEFLRGNASLEDAISLIQKRTRNYAKRQVTFFKNQFNSKTFTSVDELIKYIKEK